MKVIRNIEELSGIGRGACVTIGNFDGVHKGHQRLFRRVVEDARKQGLTGAAITFDPHPLQVLRPGGVKHISSWQQKEELIARAGIDLLLVIPFTREFAQTDAEDFVRQVVVDGLQTVKLVVGYDYAFGKGRKGDGNFLRREGERYGFSVEVIPPFYHNDQVVSSSLIRQMVTEGKMMQARELLGRPYQIRGRVQYGKQRGGGEVGFPTANLQFHEEDLVPRHGVYVTRVACNGKLYGGVLNIGRNPTFDERELVAETHIFDFNEDIYGQEIQVFLLEYLRGEVRFASVGELAAQIARDLVSARDFLAAFRQ